METLLERQGGPAKRGEVVKHIKKTQKISHFFSPKGEDPADDLSNVQKELAEANEKVVKAEKEKEDLKSKTEEFERKLVEMTNERKEVEEKTKQTKAIETKKLLSSVTKLLLSSFPADQVCLHVFKDIFWNFL